MYFFICTFQTKLLSQSSALCRSIIGFKDHINVSFGDLQWVSFYILSSIAGYSVYILKTVIVANIFVTFRDYISGPTWRSKVLSKILATQSRWNSTQNVFWFSFIKMLCGIEVAPPKTISGYYNIYLRLHLLLELRWSGAMLKRKNIQNLFWSMILYSRNCYKERCKNQIYSG